MRLPNGWGWGDEDGSGQSPAGSADISAQPQQPKMRLERAKERRGRECVPCLPHVSGACAGWGRRPRRKSAAAGAGNPRREVRPRAGVGGSTKRAGRPLPPLPPAAARARDQGLRALISSRSYRLSRAPRPSIAVLVCRALSLRRAAQRRRATTSANGKCHGGASRARRAAAVQGHRALATRVKLSTSASTVSWHKGASSGCWLPRPRGARGPVWSAVCVRTSPPCIRLHRARSHVRAG